MTQATTDAALLTLARRAGILTDWEDASGRLQRVQPFVLRHLLQALELECDTPARIKDSLYHLDREHQLANGQLVVVRRGEVLQLHSGASGNWMLTLESGQVMSGTLRQSGPGQVGLEAVNEIGYHHLELGDLSLTLAVAPERGPTVPVPALGQPRPWGLVAQIYSLNDTGHAFPGWLQGGNFSAVGRLATHAARAGASALALSPAHAMFSADPGRYSPYSPSSRLFLNVAYADPVQVLGADIVRHVLGSWGHADAQDVQGDRPVRDWPRIATLRQRLLRAVFDWFCDQGPATVRARLDSFRRHHGTALHHHAIYEALHAHYASQLGPGHGWQDWPAPLRDPASPAVAEFAGQHARDVDFHVFAQWLAHESHQQAQNTARAAGMSCGLISDLAIGTDPRGSHAWSLQDDILTSVSVGAPPDVYQTQGQNWGLTAFSPHGLRRGAYRAFIDTLRASLRGAGGIRIDHIAGMERLWLVPAGATAAEGAYLSYPRDDMLGLIALEASRHDAIVIGENLGTVSDELNRALVDHGMLGTSVLWFEREDAEPARPGSSAKDAVMGGSAEVSSSSFRPSGQWVETAVAMPSTHDLPTLHGWWQERDLLWRALLESQTCQEQAVARAERQEHRFELWKALHYDVDVALEGSEGSALDEGLLPDNTPLNAMLAFVARTPAPLALFSLEDVLGMIDQPNIPGGDVGQCLVHHPNWLQQLPVTVQDIFADADVMKRLQVIGRARSTP